MSENDNAMQQENLKETEFRDYLTQSGFLAKLTTAISAMYDVKTVPSNPIEFVRPYLYPTLINKMKELKEKNTALKSKLERLEADVENKKRDYPAALAKAEARFKASQPKTEGASQPAAENKPEEVKQEPPKPEEIKEEPPKPEEIKEEPPKPEEIKEEPPKPEEIKEEPPKPEEVKEEPPQPEEVKEEPPQLTSN